MEKEMDEEIWGKLISKWDIRKTILTHILATVSGDIRIYNFVCGPPPQCLSRPLVEILISFKTGCL